MKLIWESRIPMWMEKKPGGFLTGVCLIWVCTEVRGGEASSGLLSSSFGFTMEDISFMLCWTILCLKSDEYVYKTNPSLMILRFCHRLRN